MDLSPGFEERYGSKVCKLKKSLYDLKQSPRAWFEKFTQSVKKQGYMHIGADESYPICEILIDRPSCSFDILCG